RRAIDLGYLVSFSGMITFRAAENIRSAAAGLPLEAMLVETDTPYLAPVPHRGRPSEPAFVVETARRLAEAKGVELDRAADVTTGNCERLCMREASQAFTALRHVLPSHLARAVRVLRRGGTPVGSRAVPAIPRERGDRGRGGADRRGLRRDRHARRRGAL